MRSVFAVAYYMTATGEGASILLALLVGGVLRLYGLDAQSLWADEGIQYAYRYFERDFLASPSGALKTPLGILGSRTSGRCLPQRLVARRRAAMRGLDSRRRLGEDGVAGMCWDGGLGTDGFGMLAGGRSLRIYPTWSNTSARIHHHQLGLWPPRSRWHGR